MKLKSTFYAAWRSLLLVAGMFLVTSVSAQDGAKGVVKDTEGGGNYRSFGRAEGYDQWRLDRR